MGKLPVPVYTLHYTTAHKEHQQTLSHFAPKLQIFMTINKFWGT